jgi:hypothetical protein
MWAHTQHLPRHLIELRTRFPIVRRRVYCRDCHSEHRV